jgi:hypothetical protein
VSMLPPIIARISNKHSLPKRTFSIDNGGCSVFHVRMRRKLSLPLPSVLRSQGGDALAVSQVFIAVVTLAFSALLAGCLSPLAKHAVAFSTATATVVDGSEDAYRAAMRLRFEEQVTASVYDYDKNPTWSPYKDLAPLLSPAQLDARIKVLDGLKAYADTLVDLTSGKPSKDLEAAAQGVGTNLQGLNQSVATNFSTLVPNIPVMSTANANAASTAILALAEYLTARKVKASLPKITQQMSPTVTALCELLNSDIGVLRTQADVDYQSLITRLDQSIRHEGTAVSPYEHREEIRTLIDLADQQKANDELLAKLQAALHNLDLTHQALAAAVQGNNPESISQKIAELQAAGKDLSNYYKSLPVINANNE